MSKVVFIRKRDLLFRTVKLIVDDTVYDLKRNSCKEINLTKGTHTVKIKLDYWFSAENQLDITEKDLEIVVRQTMPDWYFALGTSILLILFILYFIDILPLFAFTIPVAIYFIPILINSLINRKNYFKVRMKEIP